MTPIPPERATAWLVLSELYLDTEHDEAALHEQAATLARTPYSIAELREIERWEVAPVVMPNMFATAGVWDGFDAAWLQARCARRIGRWGLARRVAVILGWSRLVLWATGRYWERLEPLIDAARRGEHAASSGRAG